jgi:hypothetical protein
MAIRVKPADKVAAKYASKATAAGGDYKDGLDFPKRDQAEAALAAGDAYEQGVQQAIADKRFQTGVQKAGSGKWKTKASTVGAQRFTQGVQAGAADYQKGIAPVLSTIAATELPPRYPKGDPRNLERVRVMNENLVKAKQAS